MAINQEGQYFDYTVNVTFDTAGTPPTTDEIGQTFILTEDGTPDSKVLEHKIFNGSEWKDYLDFSFSKMFVTDFDADIAGARNGVNTDFTVSRTFMQGSLKVTKNGVRQTEGALNDYVILTNNTFRFNTPPDAGDTMLCDYLNNASILIAPVVPPL